MIRFPEILRAAEDGAGAGAGGDAGASAGNPPDAGAGAGAAGSPSLVAPPAAAAAPDPWYRQHKFEEPVERFLEDRKFPDIQTALRSGIEADRLARSRNVVEKPDTTDPEKLKNWAGWQDLGWKANEQEYKLKRPQMPEGTQYDTGFEDAFRKIAHENRVPLPAAQAILDGFTKLAIEADEAVVARGSRLNREADEQLRKNWGPDYDRNVELAKRAARHFGLGAETNAELTHLMGSPKLLEMFNKIGGIMSEDSLVQLGEGPLPESVEAMESERRRKMADPTWRKSFDNPQAPNHADVKAEYQSLSERIAKAKLARSKAA